MADKVLHPAKKPAGGGTPKHTSSYTKVNGPKSSQLTNYTRGKKK